jgi:hypothetical protein
MVRGYKPAKVNFNRIVLAHPIAVHVNCPGDENDLADVAVRHAAAVDLFKRQCPLGACVEKLFPLEEKEKKSVHGECGIPGI